ncbi:unnamed protein product [Camellia sinensis]
MKLQLQGVMQNIQHKPSATTNSPFVASIRDKPLPAKFKMPTIDSFDGTTDPVDHLETYRTFMVLHAFPDEIMCRAFPVTLKGSARLWFSQLPADSVSTFQHLSDSFLSHFIGAQHQRRPATQLLNIHQTEGESLRSFVTRFNTEALQVAENDDKVILTAFMAGLRSSDFLFSLSKNPPTTMAALLSKAQRYMNVEDSLAARQEPTPKNPTPREKRKDSEPRTAQYNSQTPHYNDRPPELTGRLRPDRPVGSSGTPLSTPPWSTSSNQIQRDYLLKWPLPSRNPSTRKDQPKYCRFHQDHGHTTDECINLKDQIETFIRQGRLSRFTDPRPPQRQRTDHPRNNRRRTPPRNQAPPNEGHDRPPPQPRPPGNPPPPVGEIRVISGGLACGGPSHSAQKAELRKIRQGSDKAVTTVDRPPKQSKQWIEPITFTDTDCAGVRYPHDDPLVISAILSNYKVRRVLIDNGSSSDIIFLNCFRQLKIGEESLSPLQTPLVGFTAPAADH